MNPELDFFIKVVRNGLILSLGIFASVWAVGEFSWILCKPIVLFFLAYCSAELARHYGISIPRDKSCKTMVFP